MIRRSLLVYWIEAGAAVNLHSDRHILNAQGSWRERQLPGHHRPYLRDRQRPLLFKVVSVSSQDSFCCLLRGLEDVTDLLETPSLQAIMGHVCVISKSSQSFDAGRKELIRQPNVLVLLLIALLPFARHWIPQNGGDRLVPTQVAVGQSQRVVRCEEVYVILYSLAPSLR